jgi:hypothetical protein
MPTLMPLYSCIRCGHVFNIFVAEGRKADAPDGDRCDQESLSALPDSSIGFHGMAQIWRRKDISAMSENASFPALVDRMGPVLQALIFD